jgi:nucleoid-associated protein YgaU
MPNDAKLGMVVGVGLVIVVAVLFYRKELPVQGSPTTNVAGMPQAAALMSDARNVTLPALPTPGSLRRHTVREGDTLTKLAREYYGDASRQEILRQANQAVLRSSDEPTPGSVLVIPEEARPFPDPAGEF